MKKLSLTLLAASLALTASFAAHASKNQCLAHWKDHVQEDSLELYSCDLKDKDMDELGQILGKRNFTLLDLTQNHITEKGLENLSRYDAVYSIVTLYLGQMKMCAKAYASLANFTSLTNLGLYGSQVDDVSAMVLANNKTIKYLFLDNNNVGSAGAAALANSRSLETLFIDENHIYDEGAIALAASKTIKQLSLRSNSIASYGARALAANTTLQFLYLDDNYISNSGAAAFGDNRTLQGLSIENNYITSEGALGLAKNTTLTGLDVGRNAIGDMMIAKLATSPNLIAFDAPFTHMGKKSIAAIVNNSSLKIVSVAGNDLDDEDTVQLAGMDIHFLNVASNNIGPVGGIALAQNASLQTLFINQNHVGDEAAFEFAKTTTLGDLFILNNHLTQAGIAALEANKNIHDLWTGEFDSGAKKISRQTKHKHFSMPDKFSNFMHA